MTAPLLLHPGWPKAASTSLQVSVFARLPDVAYLGLYPETTGTGGRLGAPPAPPGTMWTESPAWRAALRSILLDPEPPSDDLIASVVERVQSRLREGTPVIVSHEEFISSRAWSLPLDEKVRRASLLFAGARVLLVNRTPEAMLQSLYRDQPWSRLDGSPISYKDWLRAESAPGRCVDACDIGAVEALWQRSFASVTRIEFTKSRDLAPQIEDGLLAWTDGSIDESVLTARLEAIERWNVGPSRLETATRRRKRGLAMAAHGVLRMARRYSSREHGVNGD